MGNLDDIEHWLKQISTTMIAGFSRVKDVWIPATGIKAPLSRPAAWVDHGVSGAWEFDDQAIEANTERIVANVKFPNDMDLTVAPTFVIGWSSTTQSADCNWSLEYLYTAPNEDTTANAQDTHTEAFTSSATAEGLTISSITMDVPGATDVCVHIRITRRSDLAPDTINGDTVELHGICLSYTADIVGAS